MALDPLLLEILACPDDKGPLLYFVDEDSLYNPRTHRRYSIRDDIPIMLVDESEVVGDEEGPDVTLRHYLARQEERKPSAMIRLYGPLVEESLGQMGLSAARAQEMGLWY